MSASFNLVLLGATQCSMLNARSSPPAANCYLLHDVFVPALSLNSFCCFVYSLTLFLDYISLVNLSDPRKICSSETSPKEEKSIKKSIQKSINRSTPTATLSDTSSYCCCPLSEVITCWASLWHFFTFTNSHKCPFCPKVSCCSSSSFWPKNVGRKMLPKNGHTCGAQAKGEAISWQTITMSRRETNKYDLQVKWKRNRSPKCN